MHKRAKAFAKSFVVSVLPVKVDLCLTFHIKSLPQIKAYCIIYLFRLALPERIPISLSTPVLLLNKFDL